MNEKFNENEPIRIILIYLIPILSWIIYTHQMMPLPFSWAVAGIGFIILFIGSALLISLFKKQPIPEKLTAYIPMPSPVIVEEPKEDLSQELFEKIASLQEALKEAELALESKEDEFADVLQTNMEMGQKLQAIQENAAQETEQARRKIELLELEFHQKQQASTHLENQIHDLRFEIKTLLQLTEVDYLQMGKDAIKKEEEPLVPVHESPQPTTARGLLTRCIDIAQKITAGYHASSLRKISLDPYAFDLRRLSEALRQETGALIIVYSPKEERVVFANSETKAILGISPEQFAQDFADYAGVDYTKWKNGIFQLLTKSEVNLSLEFQTKSGDPVHLRALLGSIPTGVFRTLVVGILHP